MRLKKLLTIPALLIVVTSFALAVISEQPPSEPDNRLEIMPDLSLQPPPPPADILPTAIPPAPPSGRSTLPSDGYLSVDVLLVIYTHYYLDAVDQSEIDVIIEEVAEAREFFARNSRCRVNVNIAGPERNRRVFRTMQQMGSFPGKKSSL